MDTKYVTAEDKTKYADFFLHHMTGIGRRRPLTPIYHYTTGNTLLKIVSSGQIWSTHVSCLNDSKEWVYAIDCFRRALAERRKAAVDAEFEPCMARMEQAATSASNTTIGVFVACFTTKPDDLSQWRAYGGPAGYSIGFDITRLGIFAANNQHLLAPVLYGFDEAKLLLDDAIKWAETYFKEGLKASRAPTADAWADDFTAYWLWNLSFYAPLIKHESFHDEAEWRLVHMLTPEDAGRLEFLQRGSMMTRHLPIELSAGVDGGPRLMPIKQVTVGPSNFAELSKIAVGDMLQKHGYDLGEVTVSTSAIPYRPAL